ncbi:MAG: aspartate/glutamate racemase family protein [Desulfocapsaceae bacterium]|nr:aspartate/glutamate racemase family protein [Desulfocapsaceae bacterium]
MKKVGIVGGIDPVSTIAYYRGIIDACSPAFEEHGYPEIAVESIDMKRAMFHVDNSRWDQVSEFIASKFEVLRAGGAAFGAIASTALHVAFDEIQSQTFLPLVSVVDATLNYTIQHNLRNLCLLGEKVTMESDCFRQMFEKEEIRLVLPNPEEQDFIHNAISSVGRSSVLKEGTKKNILAIIDRIIKDEHIDGLIAGSAAIPLLVTADEVSVHYVDSSRIHIHNIVEICKN